MALKAAADRVRARFADLASEVVDEALRTARERFSRRPVRDFVPILVVPILVERAATDALRTAAQTRPARRAALGG